eukprot:scaffold54668_cov66-Phaeocystis_antarctica.AAC.1
MQIHLVLSSGSPVVVHFRMVFLLPLFTYLLVGADPVAPAARRVGSQLPAGAVVHHRGPLSTCRRSPSGLQGPKWSKAR